MIHTDVTVRKVDGRYVVDWPMLPLAGDQVLMSIELFEQSIEALNGTLPAPPLGVRDVWAAVQLLESAPGHDAAGETRGQCRATAPCPACRQRLAEAEHGTPPTSESGVSASKDGSR